MNDFTIPTENILKIATLNLHNNPEAYLERVTAVAAEAHDNQVEIILVQEILTAEKEHVINAFNAAGYTHSHLSEAVTPRRKQAKWSSTGVFSRHPFKASRDLNLSALQGAHKASVVVVQVNDYEIHLISTHLAWGAENGFLRLKQSLILADYARRAEERNSKALVLIGGTFNDIPDGDSVRYLQGRKASDDTQSTYWVDSAEGTELEKQVTSRHHTRWGKLAAESAEILNPLFIPERRVDYIFIHGWVYGKAGMPMNTELFGVTKTLEGHELSDHYGLQTQIWLPDKK